MTTVTYHAFENTDGELFVRVVDMKTFCTEFLTAFNTLADEQVYVGTKDAIATGVRIGFDTFLDEMDRIESKYARENKQ